MTKKPYHALVSPYIMWVFVIVGAFIVFSYVPFRYAVHPHPALYVASGVALAYWLVFFMKGVTGNLEAGRRPHHISKLVTSGVYGIIRHPIYSADIVFAWGMFLVYPLVSILAATAWLTIVLVVWSYLEEKSLTELFGERYTEYKKRVPMLFPFKKL